MNADRLPERDEFFRACHQKIHISRDFFQTGSRRPEFRRARHILRLLPPSEPSGSQGSAVCRAENPDRPLLRFQVQSYEPQASRLQGQRGREPVRKQPDIEPDTSAAGEARTGVLQEACGRIQSDRHPTGQRQANRPRHERKIHFRPAVSNILRQEARRCPSV